MSGTTILPTQQRWLVSRELNKANPERWLSVRLGDVATVQNGFPFASSKFSRELGFPLIRIRDVGATDTETYFNGEYDSAFIVKSGDILIGMDGEFRARRWKGRPGLLNQRVCRVAVHSPHIDERFLFVLLQPYLKAVENATSSITVKHLSSRTVEDLEIALPPLPEQRRIVARLDELFARSRAARERLERLPALLDRLRQSVLAAAFRGDLTREWRDANPEVEPADKLLERIRIERRRKWEEELRAKGRDPAKAKYVEPEPVDASGLPELPNGWAWSSLGELSSSVRNGISSRPEETPPGIPVLRISAVRHGEVHYGERRYLQGSDSFSAYELEDGDLLFTRYNGNRELVGACGLVRDPPPGLVYPDKLIRVRVAVVEPAWVECFAISSRARAYMLGRAKSTSGQTGISGADLVRLPVPVAPIEEQKEIVRILSAVFHSERQIRSSHGSQLSRLTSLDQSLLAKAFRGELVPQDPSDEPASVLLDRIRAERAAAEASAPSRGRKSTKRATAAKRGRSANE